MALKFFDNMIGTVIDASPDQMYRDLQQEYINLQWDNTTQIVTVKEEEDIGSDVYNDLDVWIGPTVADTSTGLKDVRDFNKLIFKDINHFVKRGLMYIFENNYWIVHSYNDHDGVVQDCGIRRCNNVLKMVDPLNGGIFSIPCVVDYDMAASTVKVTKYILTPNNHAVVMVQGNSDTLRLFKTNTRFILSGRPFKLYGYQNAVEYDLNNPSTLLYLDLYLDEVRNGDDMVAGVAENGIYDYNIEINAENMTLANGATGTLTATVYLNGVETEREIVWETSNSNVVTITSDGTYHVVGEVGEDAAITAKIKGNDINTDEITISVGELEDTVKILTVPSFNVIREHTSVPFKVVVYYNGEEVKDNVMVIVGTDSEILELIDNSVKFKVDVLTGAVVSTPATDLPQELYIYSDSISAAGILDAEDLYYNGTNSYELISNGVSTIPQHLYVHVVCPNPSISATQIIEVEAKSMLG